MFEYGLYKLMINVDSIIIKILIHGLSVANFIVLVFPYNLQEQDAKGRRIGKVSHRGWN